MNQIILESYLSYIDAMEEPLSSNVVIMKGREKTWIYDVGNSEMVAYELMKLQPISIILSHFHPDHISNLRYLTFDQLLQGKHTQRYTHTGSIIESEQLIQDGDLTLRIFPFPSSHAKGSLAVIVNETYCLLGDALYPTMKAGESVYNAGLLLEQIRILEQLNVEYALLSHHKPFVKKREIIVKWLRSIYENREKNQPYIRCDMRGIQ